MLLWIVHDATFAHLAFAYLKLRLDEHDAVGMRFQKLDQYW